MARSTTPVSGVIESVNEKGIKLGGKWFNFSKHHVVPATQRGQSVTLDIEGDKWINGVTFSATVTQAPVQQSYPQPAAHVPSQTPTPAQPQTHPKTQSYPAEPEVLDARTQIRMAAIQASAAFHGTRQCDFSEVYDFAEKIEAWIGQA